MVFPRWLAERNLAEERGRRSFLGRDSLAVFGGCNARQHRATESPEEDGATHLRAFGDSELGIYRDRRRGPGNGRRAPACSHQAELPDPTLFHLRRCPLTGTFAWPRLVLNSIELPVNCCERRMTFPSFPRLRRGYCFSFRRAVIDRSSSAALASASESGKPAFTPGRWCPM